MQLGVVVVPQAWGTVARSLDEYTRRSHIQTRNSTLRRDIALREDAGDTEPGTEHVTSEMLRMGSIPRSPTCDRRRNRAETITVNSSPFWVSSLKSEASFDTANIPCDCSTHQPG